MRIKVTTWTNVITYSAVITALVVAVPLTIVSIALGALPMVLKFPVLVISGLIPLFITLPLSIFALHIFKLINQTVLTLDNLVKHDPLTGLLSRARFLQLVEHNRKNGNYLAILDADFFKKINDSHGHEAGDFALKHISVQLTQAVGNHGFVGRLGGEEFAIYLQDVSLEQAQLVLALLGTSLRMQAFNYNGVDIPVSLSAGLVADVATEAIALVLRRADRCLYRAKKNGRDRFETEIKLDEKAIVAA